MRDSLMPPRDSGGNKMVLFFLISGVLLLIAAGAIVYRQRSEAPVKEPTPEPVDTGAPMRVTQLVAPQPTKPITKDVDTGTAAEATDETEPKKKRRRPKQDQGTIDTSKYNAFINTRFGQVRACYERRLKINALLEGKIDVNINVNEQGQVNWITVNRDTVRDSEMLGCVKKTIRSWQFPEPEGGSVVVGKTFTFKKKGS